VRLWKLRTPVGAGKFYVYKQIGRVLSRRMIDFLSCQSFKVAMTFWHESLLNQAFCDLLGSLNSKVPMTSITNYSVLNIFDSTSGLLYIYPDHGSTKAS
jgi:hypothetical protein